MEELRITYMSPGELTPYPANAKKHPEEQVRHIANRCFMMELDPHYVDVIIARWEKLTGKKAVLLNG